MPCVSMRGYHVSPANRLFRGPCGLVEKCHATSPRDATWQQPESTMCHVWIDGDVMSVIRWANQQIPCGPINGQHVAPPKCPRRARDRKIKNIYKQTPSKSGGGPVAYRTYARVRGWYPNIARFITNGPKGRPVGLTLRPPPTYNILIIALTTNSPIGPLVNMSFTFLFNPGSTQPEGEAWPYDCGNVLGGRVYHYCRL
jgi:hypothetical protein